MYKKTIELFLLDGTPNNRIICSISNWDGIGFKIPRTMIKESKDRDELNNTGVYFLFNKSEKILYVGEAENVYSRILQHLSEDYWNEALIFIKKDNGLNKAHVKFLENYFYNVAKSVDRYVIKNSTVPTKSSISESEKAAMEEFAYYIRLITNTLDYKSFEKLVENENKNNEDFYINSIGLHARGRLTNEGFVVIKGSESNNEFKAASSKSLKRKWVQLRDDGVVDENGIFVKDYLFSSPSLAAAMVLGRNANGLSEWKNNKKISLKTLLINNK